MDWSLKCYFYIASMIYPGQFKFFLSSKQNLRSTFIFKLIRPSTDSFHLVRGVSARSSLDQDIVVMLLSCIYLSVSCFQNLKFSSWNDFFRNNFDSEKSTKIYTSSLLIYPKLRSYDKYVRVTCCYKSARCLNELARGT